MMTLGYRIREERERIGLNQSDFGDLASVTKATQINYEKGNRNPDTAYLLAIAKAGVDLYYLLTGKHAVTMKDVNAELRCLADAYEAIDTALYEADKYLEPNKKRQAAEALYMAYKEGEIEDLETGAGLMALSAA